MAAIPSGAAAATACDRVASPSGSDSAAGTLSSPYRTASKLVGSLNPGQTGCFRAGTYSFSSLTLETESITLAPYGSEPVTLAGHIKAYPGAANSVIEGMRLDASSASDKSGPKIYASGFVLRGNEITNGHTEICVIVGSYYSQPPPRGVVIERNRIHDCGTLPATNLEHGIYLSEARNPIVRDNWIYNNADRGVQQYPDVQGAQITGNVIANNGQGVNFSGTGSLVTTGSTVAGNIVVDSKLGHNAYSGGDGPAGINNVFRDNCVHGLEGGAGIELTPRSFLAIANLVSNPGFVNPGVGDYRLRPTSRCLAKYTGTMSLPGSGVVPPDRRSKSVTLKASRRSLPSGALLKLRGKIPGEVPTEAAVVIERRRDGAWRRVGDAPVGGDRRFAHRLRPRQPQVLQLRARVPGGGHSRTVKVKVR